MIDKIGKKCQLPRCGQNPQLVESYVPEQTTMQTASQTPATAPSADSGTPSVAAVESSSSSSQHSSSSSSAQSQQDLLAGMQNDLAAEPGQAGSGQSAPQAGPPGQSAPQAAPPGVADLLEPAADAQEPPSEWRGIRELLPELGLSPDGYEDDRAALQGLAAQALQARQLYQQNQYYQRLLREQQMPVQQQLNQQFAQPGGQHPGQQYPGQQYPGQPIQQQPLQVQQQAPAPKPFLPKLPEFDERSIEFLTRDDSGNVVAKPGADPRLVQQYHEWTRAREQAVNKLISDPQGYAEWAYQSQQEKIQQAIESRVDAKLQAYHTENDARQYIATNAQRIFQIGQNGQPLLDPATGQPAFTPYGNAFYNGLQTSAQLGLASYSDRVGYAEQVANAATLQQQVVMLQQQLAALQAGQAGGQANPAAAAQAAAVNEQRKADFINKNRGQVRKANRTATLAAAKYEGVPQNGQYRLHEMLTQGFRDEGLLESN